MQALELAPLCPLHTLLVGEGQERTAAPLVETAVVRDTQTNLLLGKLPTVGSCIPTPSHSSHEFSLAKRLAENAEAPVGESLSFCE
jgi:hypothetical protein